MPADPTTISEPSRICRNGEQKRDTNYTITQLSRICRNGEQERDTGRYAWI